MTPRYLMKIAADMAQAVIAVIPAAANEVMPMLGYSEKVLAERLSEKIVGIAKKTSARLVS